MNYTITPPKFTGRNVPLVEIAQATGKSAQFLRVGLQRGILKFGFAYKMTAPASIVTTAPIKRYGRSLATLPKQLPQERTVTELYDAGRKNDRPRLICWRRCGAVKQ